MNHNLPTEREMAMGVIIFILSIQIFYGQPLTEDHNWVVFGLILAPFIWGVITGDGGEAPIRNNL